MRRGERGNIAHRWLNELRPAKRDRRQGRVRIGALGFALTIAFPFALRGLLRRPRRAAWLSGWRWALGGLLLLRRSRWLLSRLGGSAGSTLLLGRGVGLVTGLLLLLRRHGCRWAGRLWLRLLRRLRLLLLHLRVSRGGTAAHAARLFGIALFAQIIRALQIAADPIRVLCQCAATIEREPDKDSKTENHPLHAIFSLLTLPDRDPRILSILTHCPVTLCRTGNVSACWQRAFVTPPTGPAW